ncbi:MAG: tetratricopeptide repeat protein [Elusimicrobia bacterium]|nr:tetratricopeptide repeat protein [Candidatus Liberimonas magnetica]
MNTRKSISLVIVTVLLLFDATVMLMSAGSGPSSNWPIEEKRDAPETAMSLYDKGVAADKAGDNETAFDYFKQALKKDKKNPDILNMLAHSERKLGMINEAIDDYWKALKIRPKFPQAREYMGEAYIQATLKEIETLKSYGIEAEEEYNDLIKAFKEAAASLK